MADILERRIALACPVEHAFEVFTDRIDLWWPPGHRRHREGELRLSDGAITDHSPDGSAWMMARVTAFEPPHRLALDWLPGSPAAPTRVEIVFAPAEAGTVITITHSAPTAEAAAIWPQRVETFTRGWDAVLPALKTFIEES